MGLDFGLGFGLGFGLRLGIGDSGDGHAVENFSMGVPHSVEGYNSKSNIWRVTAEEAKAYLGAGDCKNRR